MTFHIRHRAQFLDRPLPTDVEELLGAAGTYAVQLQPVDPKPGQYCWRAIGVHHLTPEENRGRHAVYIDVVDENGNILRDPRLQVRWGWDGQEEYQAAHPCTLNKPLSEPATNVDLFHGQRVWIQIDDDELPSDMVRNLHTKHPDELGPNGETWNSLGHHSFYVVFQQLRHNSDGKSGVEVPTTVNNKTQNKPDNGHGGHGDGSHRSSAFRFEVWPTPDSAITQRFGENPQNYSQFNLPGHEGIDILAAPGAPIVAVAPGVVKMVHELSQPQARQDHPYGNHVRIQHADNYETIYAHLQTISVTQGHAVSAGTQLGLAGNTGNSRGTHLHLTLKHYGTQLPGYPPGVIDPLPFLLPLLPATADDAIYLSDVITDGTKVHGGETVAQRWTIRNTGANQWHGGYVLVFEQGDRLHESNVLPVPATAPGAQATIALTFRAPSAPGNYRSYWRMRNPNGQWFGERLWVDITVKAEPTPIKVTRGNKLGFYLHLSTDQFGMWNAVSRVQPPVVLIHADTANDMLLNEIRAHRAPDAFVIGRWYLPNDKQRALLEGADPAGEGRRLAEEIVQYDFGKFTRRDGNGRLLIDAWMSLNECLPGPASGSYRDNPSEYQRLYAAYDAFQVAFRARLVEAGIEAVAFNFAAGNFVKPEHYLDFFPETLASHTYLGFHEYGWPALMPGPGVHTSAGLYRGVLEAVRARYGTDHRVIMTEAGLTRAYGHPQNPDEGWLNHEESLDQNRYWESLAWYNHQLSQDDYVLGACLYEVGHDGNWVSFRHLGNNNQGQPLHLVERMASLRTAASPTPPQGAAALDGAIHEGLRATPHPSETVRGHMDLPRELATEPVNAAQCMVSLRGDLAALGALRGAVVDLPDALTWTRELHGYRGTLRNVWDRFVAGEVAGITWAEFKTQMLLVNPSLLETDGELQATEHYLLPTTTSTPPAIIWDRVVNGYSGTIYQAWLDLLQGKVIGLDYAAFRRQIHAYNPALGENRLVAIESYLLPRTVGATSYRVAVNVSPSGYFRFDDLPAGDYTLTASAPGQIATNVAISVPQGEPCLLPMYMTLTTVSGTPRTVALPATDGQRRSEEGPAHPYPVVYAQCILNLRRTPGYLSKPADHVIGHIAPGTALTIFGFPATADKLTWWQARAPLQNGESTVGWVAQENSHGVQLLGMHPPEVITKVDPLTKLPDEPDMAGPEFGEPEVDEPIGKEIHLARPFAGRWRITQGWGARADYYRRFKYNGVPLQGHNGLDYGTPVATELLATDGGKVKWVGYEEQGFGHYLILQHTWGESLYAHLSRVDVGVGMPVARGQQVALSGNSGNSSGPHLHFGIRITPYRRDDGWGGFSDPTPFL